MLELDDLWAHTPTDGPGPHRLSDHLTSTGELARQFSERLGLGDIGALLGLWHDLGKAHPGFQRYLKALAEDRDATSVRHAIWGAALGYELQTAGGPWRELALPIAGHHAGLKAPSKLKNDIGEAVEREPDFYESLQALAAELPMPAEISASSLDPLDREFRIRMLLAVLADADRLDTEAYDRPEIGRSRGFDFSIMQLWDDLQTSQRELMADASATRVNAVRKEVYEACLEAAASQQGVFRLTVPTGGGKTRSGLAFALRHAMEHDLDRVIVAIPYTSIIDQTADVYREVFGDGVVLEHHSRVEPQDDEGEETRQLRLRLATQNWDAPIVVTTTVQFFESLFSYHPSAVRKIHRIANSVVILDEVQTLPPGLLEPTMDVLRTLVQTYGTSIVLSTATQPALHGTPYVQVFDELGVREIVSAYTDHFEDLQRVRYHLSPESASWDEIAERIDQEPQVLAILNTRRDARSLLDALPSTEEAFHLSALLCSAHRRDQLREIKSRLKEDRPARVVSTQVVEAGVDIDFPVVYRALGPLDRIVQAAGRCNREGRWDRGEVFLFEPAEGGAPQGAYRTGIGHARNLLRDGNLERLHDPEIFTTYFKRLFRDQDLDEKNVQSLRRKLRYRVTGDQYRLIEQDTLPVVVDYRERGHRLATAWMEHPTREAFVRLQPYIVNLYRHEVEQYRRSGWASPLGDQTDLHLWEGKYHELYGIQESVRDPADLVIGS